MNDDSDFDNVPPTASPGSRQMDTIPDGRYTATVADVSFFVSKSSGAKCESWWFTINSGPYQGKQVQRYTYGIDSRSAGRVKANVIMVAREPRADVMWAELHDATLGGTQAWVRDQCLGAVVEISQKSKRGDTKTFVDVYINGRVAAAPVRAAVPAAALAPRPRPTPAPPPDDGWADGGDGGWAADDGDVIPY